MSTQVEKRVLELEFNNKNFEKNIQRSMSALATFQKTIEGAEGESKKFSLKGMITALSNATKKFGLFKTSAQKDIGDIQSASNKFNMQSVATNLDSIASRFSNLGIIGMSVLNDLTHRAIDFGISMAKNVLSPIVEGGKKRAFNIENARFTLQGLFKDEEKVDEIMKRAMASVEGTAYGFDQAANAASQFAASGMDMDQLSTSLSALAGVSAVFNADYEGMAHIFTTMASNGRVMGHQLTQLSTYGMPVASILTESFNKVLEGSSKLSEGMQKDIQDIINYGRENIEGFSSDINHITEGDLRKLVERGVISFDMFSAIMADSFGDQATKANETFSGSMANIRAALARTGALFFRFDDDIGIIRQNGELVKFLNQIIELINKFNDYIKPFAKTFTETFNNVLGSMVEALEGGALENIFVGISTTLTIIGDTLKYIGFAFRDVFNLKDIDLVDKIKEMALNFREFAESMKPSTEQLVNIKKIASGVFAVFKIFGQVILAVIRTIVKLVQALQPLWDVLLDVALAFSDWVVGLSEAIDEAGIFDTVVERLSKAFSYLGTFVGFVAGLIVDFFKWIGNGIKDITSFGNGFNKLADKFNKFKETNDEVNDSLERFKEKLNSIKAFFGKIGDSISSFGDNLKEKFSGLSDMFNTENIFNASMLINEGLFAAISIMFIKLLGTFQKFVKGLQSPVSKFQEFMSNLSKLPGKFSESLGNLFGTLKKGQQEVQPNMIVKIALALGILALSLMLIGSLDLEHMAVGLAGLVGVMASMLVFLKFLPKLMESMTMTGKDRKGNPKAMYAKLIVFAAALVLISLAVLLMASAMKKLGGLDYEEVVRGIVGLASVMAILVAGAKSLSKITGGLIRTSIGLILLAIALNLLVHPVKSLAKLKPEQLITGLMGLGATLLLLVMFMKLIDSIKFSASSAASLILLAVALNLMIIPVKKLGEMPLEKLAAGLGAVGIILLELAGFMALFSLAAKKMNSGSMMASAFALLIISAAIAIMAKVVTVLAGLDYIQLIKGLGGLAAILVGVGLFTRLVNSEKIISVAFAMLIFGGAMVIMAEAIKTMGEMKLENLIQGMIALAVALIIFGVASQAMENATKGAVAIAIIALALVPLAFALSLLSAIPFPALLGGIIAIAAVFVIFGVAAKVLGGSIPIMLALAGVLVLLGIACLAVGVGIGVAAWGIGTLVAAIAAGGSMLIATVTQLIYLLPTFFQQLGLAVVEFLKSIANSWTELKNSLITIARGLIDVFVTVIPEAVNAVLQFILAIVQALVENIPVIVDAILQLITGVLQAVADNIQPIVEAGLSIATNFINGVAEGIGPLIDAAFNLIVQFIDGLATAIDNNHDALYDAVEHLIQSIVQAIIDLATRMWEGAQELWDKFKEKWDEFVEKAKELGQNIVNGIIDGITGMGTAIWEGAQELGSNLWHGFLGALGIESPSTQFAYAGEMCLEGLIQGISDQSELNTKMGNVASDMLKAFGDQTGPAENAAKLMSSSIVAGFNANTSILTTMANTQANSYLDTFKKKSAAAKAAGAALVNGVVNAVKGNTAAFSSAGATAGSSYVSGIASAVSRASGAGSALANAVTNGVGSSSLYSAGVNAGNGFANGLRSTIARVRDAAGTIASVAAAKIRAFLNIGSPSKLLHQYGVWTAEGLANGMVDTIPEVTASAEELAEASFESLTNSMNKLSKINYDLLDIDAEPTITPVVDLTNVNSAKSQLDSIFAAQRMIGSLDSMAQSIAYSFSSRGASANGINKVDGFSDETQVNDTFNRIADSLENNDNLTATEIRALRDDVKAMKIYLDSGQLVGGLVTNSRRRAAMNV